MKNLPNLKQLLAALLTIAALATGQTARADNVALSEDSDIPQGTAGHWYVNMPFQTTDYLTLSAADLTTCGYTFKVYDDGGKDGNYSANCRGRLTITVPEVYAFQVTGTIWTQHNNKEDLRFFKGDNATNIIGDKWNSDTDGEPKTVGPVTCDGNVMSLRFDSDGTGTQYAGLDLTVTVVNVSTDYTVSISNPAHGTLTVNKTTARLGETVIVRPTPDTDFATAEVSYTVGTIKYVINPVNNLYSFTMPAYDVSVGAVFMDEETLWGGADADGTEEHPYVISNQAGWNLLFEKSKIENYTNNLHFRLDSDITTDRGLLRFVGGHLDGNGHTVTLSDADYFIAMAANATFTDLTVKGSITGGIFFVSSGNGSMTRCLINITIGSIGDTPSLFVSGGSTNVTNCIVVFNGTARYCVSGSVNSANFYTTAFIASYPLTLGDFTSVVRSGGTLIADGSATVYADGFNLNGTKYYATGVTITLIPPTGGVSSTAAQYNDGSNHAATLNPDGTATFTIPAAATTASFTGFAANYIDADGTEQTHAVSLLSSSNGTVNKEGGWYAVIGNVTIGSLHFNGETHLILTDGATLTVNACTFVNNNLYVYGQTLGTGTLYTHHEKVPAALLGEVYYAYGMKVTGNITFCGGQVKVWAVAKPKMTPLDEGSVIGYGIYANGNVTIIRGHLYASAFKTQNSAAGELYFIIANDIILDWRLPTDRIFITNLDKNISGSNIVRPSAYCYSNMRVADGKTLWNGTKVLSDTIYDSNCNIIDQMNFVNKTLQPCITREVAGYEESTASDHWAFIASPVTGSINPTSVVGLVASTATEYDLYRFNQSAAKEWENYKAHSSDFNLVNGQGYLYATKETKTLVFKGDALNMSTEDVEVPLAYDENAEFAGWNLVGNPFEVEAYVNRPFYKMNDDGTGIEPVDITQNPEPIAVGTGIMVQAEGANDSVIFSKPTRHGSADNHGGLRLALLSGTEVVDNAILSFNEGSKLGKFYFGQQDANIYIPQGQEEYAIAFSESQGEMPLNFKANADGQYTLTVSATANSQLPTVNYLHLIDNMTGADIDLLAMNNGDARHGDARPCVSTYTFTAKTTDYESRFKLVFSASTDANGDNEAFAFIDASSNIIINGTGTLQVIDITGRVLYTTEANSAFHIQHSAFPTPGVYVLRLINGENVRTQKIVVE